MRRAEPDDQGGIDRLLEACGRAAASRGPAWRAWVIEDGQEIVATASLDREGDRVALGPVAVDPGHRGQGFDRELRDAALTVGRAYGVLDGQRAGTVRPAVAADAPAVAAAYNEGIADRIATFEIEPRRPDEMGTGTKPMLVGERDGTFLGAAWASPYSPRPCYAGVGHASVYIARSARGGGMGRMLIEELADACAAAGYWKLLAGVFPENTASLALCRVAGFHDLGTHRRHGQLDGNWRNVVLLELLLFPAASPPR